MNTLLSGVVSDEASTPTMGPFGLRTERKGGSVSSFRGTLMEGAVKVDDVTAVSVVAPTVVVV